MVILHGKIKSSDFELTSSISTYLQAICRNLWLAELRRRKHLTHEVENTPDEPMDIEGLLTNEGRFGLAERALRS